MKCESTVSILISLIKVGGATGLQRLFSAHLHVPNLEIQLQIERVAIKIYKVVMCRRQSVGLLTSLLKSQTQVTSELPQRSQVQLQDASWHEVCVRSDAGQAPPGAAAGL